LQPNPKAGSVSAFDALPPFYRKAEKLRREREGSKDMSLGKAILILILLVVSFNLLLFSLMRRSIAAAKAKEENRDDG
jgi:hypothetical protein